MQKSSLGGSALRAALLGAASVAAISTAQAQVVNGDFSGGSTGWTTVITNGGSVNYSGGQLTVIGNDSTGSGHTARAQQIATLGSTLTFKLLSYNSGDSGQYDRPFFSLNGTNYRLNADGTVTAGLSTTIGGIANGAQVFSPISFSVNVSPGVNTFGFGVWSADGILGAGTAVFDDIFSLVGCPVTVGDDTCLIDSTTNQATAIDALGHATGDTLQVGGPMNFNFEVNRIGTTYTNFENFQKVGASNVTLINAAGVAANWQVQAGTLTASGGDAIFDTSNVNVSAGATFALAGNETIGSLTGAAGSFVDLGPSTLTTGGDNSSTTFLGVVSGASGKLIKQGAGTFTLSNTNTYTGGTDINAGRIDVSANNALGAGTVAINNAALRGTANVSLSNNLDFNAGTDVVSAAAGTTLTLGGASIFFRDNSVAQFGAVGDTGVVVLAPTSSIAVQGTANLKIEAGTLRIGNFLASIGLSHGALAVPGTGATVNGAVDINGFDTGLFNLSGTGFIQNDGAAAATLTVRSELSSTFSGVIQNGASVTNLTKTGSQTLTLSGGSSYTGATNVNAGVLRITHGFALGSTLGGTTVANDAALEVQGGIFVNAEALTLNGTGIANGGALRNVSAFNGWAGSILLGSASRINSDAGTLQLSGAVNNNGHLLTVGGAGETRFSAGAIISGVGGLTKDGTGIVSLFDANIYTGDTTINDGVLQLFFGSAIDNNGAVVVNAPGQLQVWASETIGSLDSNGSVLLVNGSTLTTGFNNANTTFSGGIGESGGVGGLTKVGTGTFTLTGANSYTGATNINAGVLNIRNATALGTIAGGTTAANGAALELQGGITVVGEALTLNGTGIANGGALRSVSGFNTYSGPITLASAARINSDANSLGLTGAVNNGGFLLTVGGAGAMTFSGAAVISGAGGLTKDGTGTASLFTANTYLGVTTVNNGVLQITGGSAIANTGAVVVNAPGQLQVFASESIGSLEGNGSVLISGGSTLTTGLDNTNTIFSGVISEQLGSGIFVKQGTGNFTLSGANTYTGATTVSAGTLTLAGGSAIANTGAVTVASGATLALTASETIGSLAGVAGAALSLGANTLTTGDAASTSYLGTTSGTGGLTKTGSGKFSTGALGHTGLTTVSAGELNTNGAVAGSVTVANNATFSGNFNVLGTLTGVGPNSIISVGNSPGSATIASLAGVTAQTVEVQFNNAGVPVNGTTHDFLNITGNVTGTHTVNIVPFAPSTTPAATTGNGMELVRVGGATTAGAFVLSGPVIQGGFEYALKYLANYSGTTDGYFLQSGARQELVAAASANMASAALNAACGSVDNRIDAAKNSRRHAWVTGENGSLETGADSGVVSDGDTSCVNTGMTFASGLTGVNIGFSLGFGSYDGDLTLVSGGASFDGERFGAEAILSYAQDIFFATAAAGVVNQDFRFKGTAVDASGSASGMTANIAAGVQLPVAGMIDVTLAGVFDYNDAVCRDACFGFAPYTEGDAIMTGSVRASAKAHLGRFSPYGSLSYSSVLSDDAATVLGAPTTSFAGDGMLAATFGASVHLSPAAILFIEGRYKESSDVDAKGQSVAAGIRAAW